MLKYKTENIKDSNIIDFIYNAWYKINKFYQKKLIIKSFKNDSIPLATDGSEDKELLKIPKEYIGHMIMMILIKKIKIKKKVKLMKMIIIYAFKIAKKIITILDIKMWNLSKNYVNQEMWLWKYKFSCIKSYESRNHHFGNV